MLVMIVGLFYAFDKFDKYDYRIKQGAVEVQSNICKLDLVTSRKKVSFRFMARILMNVECMKSQ